MRRPNTFVSFLFVGSVFMTLGAKPTKPLSEPASIVAGQASRLGIDYDKLLAAARTKKEYLPIFMSIGLCPATDGAGTDDFCVDLNELLKKHGDAEFAAALKRFSAASRIELLDFVLYDVGITKPSDWRNFAANYPKTAALAGPGDHVDK